MTGVNRGEGLTSGFRAVFGVGLAAPAGFLAFVPNGLRVLDGGSILDLVALQILGVSFIGMLFAAAVVLAGDRAPTLVRCGTIVLLICIGAAIAYLVIDGFRNGHGVGVVALYAQIVTGIVLLRTGIRWPLKEKLRTTKHSLT